ncbi:hypothetical protein [Microbacterium sp. MYb64]|uniref:hypothetical protein n=1 Tax=Microbacterium sp. MYb64 TaxID=1848691 RepID=UPI000CFBD96A|nr:hypothetical protein [Microbacterium sp. MYb64]PRB01757.1 hypothetical protein CQ044_16545 [Microbacterium sp. MYb64]
MGKKTAPEEPGHIFVRGEGGTVFKLDLPLHETIEQRLHRGYLTRVANADGGVYTGEDAGTVTSRPALTALKPDWVSWAVVQGMTPDDAEALTKTDLIERFGTTEQ